MTAIEKLYPVFISGAAICTDTRSIIPGSIFFALKGPSFNGNNFAETALQHGAAFCVVDEGSNSNDRFIQVDDVLTFLQQFATYHREKLSIPFIGITGSNGKTTTKELIGRVLAKKYNTIFTKGNLNNHIGVPLTLLSVNSTHEIAIIEMGANHQGEIAALCEIAQPTHVLITNVGKAHLEGFGGFEGVKKGKGELYAFAKKSGAYIFINNDNSHLTGMLNSYEKIISYGSSDMNDINGSLLPGSDFVSLKWRTKQSQEWNHAVSNITGSYNFENILAAITTGVFFSVSDDLINDAITGYHPDNQRSQIIDKGTFRIVMDAYNANPTSMEAAIKNFKQNFKGKKAALLGDMFELGDNSDVEHREIAKLASGSSFEFLVFVGPKFKNAAGEEQALYFENSDAAAQWIKIQQLEGFTILIKGSRGSKMEKVLDAL